MSDVTIYHNPRCSKSRATLTRLEARGVQARIIEYLDTPPSLEDLQDIVSRLGIAPQQLLRRDEEVFKQKYAGQTLTDPQCLEAMVRDPVLIERPIVVRGDKAVVGRPPENIDVLFDA